MVTSATSQTAERADQLGVGVGLALHRCARILADEWASSGRLARRMDDAIRIRPARRAPDFDTCVTLQRAVWGLADLEITSALQLIAATLHAGGMLHLAETRSGKAVGFAYAFPALRGGRARTCIPTCWPSSPSCRSSGVGVRLKWAAARGRPGARGRPHHLDLRPAAGPQRAT